MKDQNKTQKQLNNELIELRQRTAELEKLETEYSKAEKSLKESEERYRELFDEAPVGYHEYDQEGRITDVNRKELEMLGYTREEMVGEFIWKFHIEEEVSHQQVLAKLSDALPPGRNRERTYRRKDGTTFPALFEDRLIRDEKGQIKGIRCAIQDITERKQMEEALVKTRNELEQRVIDRTSQLAQKMEEGRQAEEALRQSEERYRTLVEESFDGIFVQKGPKIVFANKRIHELLDYDKFEIEGLDHWLVYHPDYQELTRERAEARMRGEEVPSQYEVKLHRKDGSSFNGEINARKIMFGNEPGIQVWVRDITERKRAEEALREREEQYRQLFEMESDALFLIDNQTGQILEANHTASLLYGYSHEELLSMKNTDLSAEPEETQHITQGTPVMVDNVVTIPLRWHRKKDSAVFPIEVTGRFFQRKGRSVHIAAIRDISERKRVEEALRIEKERFQTLSEEAPFGMVMIDQDNTFRYINPKFRELFGYELNDVPDGKTWFRKAYPDPTYRHRVIGAWLKDLEVSKPGEKRSKVFTVTCKGGSEKNINFIPVQLATGENLMACEDITERKRSEEALRESEEKFRIQYQDSPIPVFTWQREGNDFVLKGFNSMAEAATKGMAASFISKTASELYKNRPDILQHLHGCYSEKRTIRVEMESQHFFPGRMIAATFGFIPPETVMVYVEDITERKQAEEEKVALEAQFRQSQKMEAIGQLAGGIAHDFNNLLTVIRGYSQLTLRELQKHDPLCENIEEIEKAANRASELTRQLLAFSRRQLLEFKVINLNVLIEGMEKMLRRMIRENIELIIEPGENLGKIKADPGQIEQVILNLAVNAKDAMPSEGKLILKTENIKLDEGFVKSHLGSKPGHYVRLRVTDTGCGMSREVKERVFEPFFTTKDKGEGTGLGLSTVYGIVKQSEGYIWVSSEPGRGTSIEIYLPRVDEGVEELKEEEEKQEGDFWGDETILVVEDDETVRKLAVYLLRKCGYKVIEALHGGDALLVCERYLEPIHLIVSDVVMPGMGGPELIERLRQVRQDFRVLYMSGYTDEPVVSQGVQEGEMEFIQKPFTLDGLAKKVRNVLDK